jgi:glutamine amidotransferase
MSHLITIIDYGMGNLRSVQKGFEKVGFDARVTDDPGVAAKADRLVLPGVGAFQDCMNNLREGGFIDPILQHVASGKPFLGICLGLQLLFTESEEFGLHKGLDIVAGRVRKFPADLEADGEPLKVPHMGWNQVHIQRSHPLLDEVPDGSFAYFVHSYYVEPAAPSLAVAETDYGIDFASVIGRGALCGIQFHPEKSQQVGLRILANFARLSGVLNPS